ncbi:MAG: beta-lactamase family protein [Chitinophagaceae bacterium]|nr:beta-lactamase family protein [Chitinophagaceae bacterium]
MSYKTSWMCLKFSAALVFMLFLHSTYGQSNFAGVTELLGDKKQLAGGNASAIIWKDSGIIYRKDTGSLKLGKAEVQVPIGAASRWLTVALVMTFVDEGKLSLDDRVSDYIPVFKSYSKGYITIRQCLANTTGIEAERAAKLAQKKKFETLEEEVNYYAAHYDIVNNPGKDFFYGNSGINIAGRVLEVISKRKTFDRLMSERIIKPLGMKKTTFLPETGSLDPATGARSIASDYVRLLAMYLNKGVLNGKRILSEKSVEEIHKMQITSEVIKYTPKIMEGSSYGLGVFLEEGGKVWNCPSFTGSWVFIDTCGKYACVLFTPLLTGEPKKDFYLKVKEAIDVQIGCR